MALTMAPLAAKRKSSETDFDAPHNNETPQTPPEGPPQKKIRITRNQKQALIDNLQLEITERARKLRAQYALQASDLRARIERRINRVPLGLRKAKMGELLEKHSVAALRAQQQTVAASKKPASPSKSRHITAISADQAVRNSPARRSRKPSREGLYSDKENVPSASMPGDTLINPKRRAKPGAASGPSRVVSEEVRGADYRILSPKSLNSRTYPHSPFIASPDKHRNPSYLYHPVSPLKPSSPLKTANATMTGDNARSRPSRVATSTSSRQPSQSQSKRTASRTASRTAASSKPVRSPLAAPPVTRRHDRKASTGTNSSSSSSGTAVVRPMRAVANNGMSKGTPASSTSAASKKATATRNQALPAAAKRTAATATRNPTTSTTTETPTAGRRTLRKRV